MLRAKWKVNSSLTVEVQAMTDQEPEPHELRERCEAQRRVLEKIGWTWEGYVELTRLLIRRKDINVEELSPAERREWFDIQYGLAASFKGMIPPSQFGFLGGRPTKIPPESHAKVREEFAELVKQHIPKSEAYAIVARNWNGASPATIKRICEDRNPLTAANTPATFRTNSQRVHQP